MNLPVLIFVRLSYYASQKRIFPFGILVTCKIPKGNILSAPKPWESDDLERERREVGFG